MIDSGLSFSEHTHTVSKKANGIMAAIRRIYSYLVISCFSTLYKALVRKQVKQVRHLCYSERVKVLNLPILRYRRHRGDMIEVYKILAYITFMIRMSFVTFYMSRNTTTRGHLLRLSTQPSTLDIYGNTVLQ